MIKLHPKPLTPAIKLTRAHFAGLSSDDEHRQLSDRVRRYAPHHPGGWSTNRSLLTKLSNGVSHSSAGLKWAEWGRTPGTIIKQEICDCGIVHPNRQRYLSMNELKVIGGFPQSFDFSTRKNAVARIGNSVPPPVTNAIAKHLMGIFKLETFASLFAGCGGSSYGYTMAGLRELFAVEYDKSAADTFARNFPGVRLLRTDVRQVNSDMLAGIRVDLLDGSPPCQGFSSAGLRKVNDDRNDMVLEFVRIAAILLPKVVVIENVKAMTSGPMIGYVLAARDGLESLGYTVQYQVINACYYNVPQARKRLFLIGYRL